MKKIVFLYCFFMIKVGTALNGINADPVDPLTNITSAGDVIKETEITDAANTFYMDIVNSATNPLYMVKDSPHIEEFEDADRICSKIYSNIAIIRKALFADEGLATIPVYANKEKFFTCFKNNHEAIQSAFSKVNCGVFYFAGLSLFSKFRTAHEFRDFEIRGTLNHVPNFEEGPSDVRTARHKLDNAYERLVDWFDDTMLIYEFMVEADRETKSNSRILSFMQRQTKRNGSTAIDDLKEAYEAFVATLWRSFAEQRPLASLICDDHSFLGSV